MQLHRQWFVNLQREVNASTESPGLDGQFKESERERDIRMEGERRDTGCGLRPRRLCQQREE